MTGWFFALAFYVIGFSAMLAFIWTGQAKVFTVLIVAFWPIVVVAGLFLNLFDRMFSNE